MSGHVYSSEITTTVQNTLGCPNSLCSCLRGGVVVVNDSESSSRIERIKEMPRTISGTLLNLFK